MKIIMEIALQRIHDCFNGKLDLSCLDLTEIPSLPDGIVELRCSNNRLTSLPQLPSGLQTLYCSNNQLTSLPPLPSSLKTFICQFNQLTILPPLSTSLDVMVCDLNQLTMLPELPVSLTHLSCDGNQLTSLPSLSDGLEKLYCYDNPLLYLPDLPFTLTGLACELPYSNHLFVSNQLSHESIAQINRENHEWMECQSKVRSMDRCSTYYEELMCVRWHPDRVEYLSTLGYMPDDM